MELTGGKLQTDKSDGGIGVWVSEIAWKDFYVHVSLFLLSHIHSLLLLSFL